MDQRSPIKVENATEILLEFLRSAGLTEAIANLEHNLEGQTGEESKGSASKTGISRELLVATMVVRSELGRMNDLIHASAIVLALPYLLEPGERIKVRPSLAAGNDPTRPFDLETDRRIAEFKLSRWTGSDAGRKRQTFKDLVGLAMDTSGRRSELYVLGTSPARFLRTTTSAAAWALDRGSMKLRERFIARYGALDIPIPQFIKTHANQVEIIDLAVKVPELFSILEAIPPPTEEAAEP